MKYLFFLLIFLYISCDDGSSIYKVVGTIHSIDSIAQKATIAHDTIPNLMMPMIMPFYIRNKNEINKIQIGDSVHFELVWNDTKPYSRNFIIIGKGYVPNYDGFFDDEFSEKNIGSILDDVSLLNLDSTVVNLSQTDGGYRFISYIFSRCPMPNLCPAIVLKNAALVNKFPNINFIMVSFDYKHDIPSVLDQYYSSSVGNFKNWHVWSSSGRINDVYQLVRQSGGDFWGIEQEKIGHTLSSILIGPEREVLGKWKGEDWQVEKVENAISLLIK
jgi:protein SCO1/2